MTRPRLDRATWETDSRPMALVQALPDRTPPRSLVLAAGTFFLPWPHLFRDETEREFLITSLAAYDGVGEFDIALRKEYAEELRQVARVHSVFELGMAETQRLLLGIVLSQSDPIDLPVFLRLFQRFFPAQERPRLQEHLCTVVREVFPNPFAPRLPIPRWEGRGWHIPAPDHRSCVVTENARAIAEQIHHHAGWADLPILADALEDSGCADAEVLDHFRSPGPHLRGCWALDVVLQRHPMTN
ncbi:MAG: hypothetical protein ACRCZF_03585 [Gemmataceae bacterium]